MASVLLRGITKRFDEVVAVNSINLEIADREFWRIGSCLEAIGWHPG